MTTTVTAEALKPGMTIAWTTWSGAEATARVTTVERSPAGVPRAVYTNHKGVYWESTIIGDVNAALARTKGLRIVEEAS